MTNDVTDYDLFDYDYREYWKARQYEDLAERNVLQKILKADYSFYNLNFLCFCQ